jgi:hypothetical protein
MIGAERVLDAQTADRLRVRAHPGGLLVGHDRERAPILLPVFRPRPTYLVLVGGLWVARVLVFRALALGPRIVLHTADPRRWGGMDEAATGGANRIHVTTADLTSPVPASPEEPVLYVADGVPPPRGVLAPWQTRLQIAPTLTPEAGAALREADAALLQRMWPEECAEALELFGAEGPPDALARIRDDAVALVAGNAYRLAWLAPTDLEQTMFGPPSRG